MVWRFDVMRAGSHVTGTWRQKLITLHCAPGYYLSIISPTLPTSFEVRTRQPVSANNP